MSRTAAAPRIAAGLLVLTAATLVAAAGFGVAGHDLTAAFGFTPVLLAFAIVGAIVAGRRPRNPIGWLFLAEGLTFAFGVATAAYAAFAAGQGRSPAVAAWADWAGAATAELGYLFALAILLFPDGHLPSRRWRPLAWLLVTAEAVGVAAALTSGAAMRAQGSRLPSPVRLVPESVAGPAVGIFQTVMIPLVLAAAAGCALRYRRSAADERHQIKWFAFGGGITGLGLVIAGAVLKNPLPAFLALGPLIPAGAGIGIMRYRLYDIDVVISKTLVYGSLAALITGVYVLVVVVAGSVGAGLAPAGSAGLGLSILATAIVAVLFQPARQRLQRLANRLVYGQRATPYELLSAFSARLGEAYATEDLLPRLAQMLAEGTAAAAAQVWLRQDAELEAGRVVAACRPSASASAVPRHGGALRRPGPRGGREWPGPPGGAGLAPGRAAGRARGQQAPGRAADAGR